MPKVAACKSARGAGGIGSWRAVATTVAVGVSSEHAAAGRQAARAAADDGR